MAKRKENLDNTTIDLVGKIVYQTRGWGCCRPLFYKVVGIKGKKTLLIEKIPQAYDSKYGDNSPGYLTVPEEAVLNRSPEDVDPKLYRQWFTFECEHREHNPFECYLRKGSIQDEEYYYLHAPRDDYGFGSEGHFFLWEGDAKSGCCD